MSSVPAASAVIVVTWLGVLGIPLREGRSFLAGVPFAAMAGVVGKKPSSLPYRPPHALTALQTGSSAERLSDTSRRGIATTTYTAVGYPEALARLGLPTSLAPTRASRIRLDAPVGATDASSSRAPERTTRSEKWVV